MEGEQKLSPKKLNELPTASGVYLFYEKTAIIYIGKAINLRERVKSHFQQPSYRDNLFMDKVTRIGFIETDSEIEALVLEARLIKKRLPRFNVVWRDNKNYFYVAIARAPIARAKVRTTSEVVQTSEQVPWTSGVHGAQVPWTSGVHGAAGREYVFLTHQKDAPDTHYIGPFVEGNSVKKILKYLRRVFPYYTSKSHSKQKCTWCHLGLCPGPEPDLAAYQKSIRQLALVLKGKRGSVLKSLKREMNRRSREKRFEEAAKIRDRFLALERIMAHARVIEAPANAGQWQKTERILQGLLNIAQPVSRLECYDISNNQGKQAVGSMAVFIDGKPAKSQYRKFKVKMENEPNDIAMLGEVLRRRLQNDQWPYPQIMLIDGGIAQLNAGISAKRRFLKARDIRIISIAKRNKELFIEGKPEPVLLKTLPREVYNLVIHADDEAHRFAITYHKKLRRKELLA